MLISENLKLNVIMMMMTMTMMGTQTRPNDWGNCPTHSKPANDNGIDAGRINSNLTEQQSTAATPTTCDLNKNNRQAIIKLQLLPLT